MERGSWDIVRFLEVLFIGALLGITNLAAAQSDTALAWKLPDGVKTVEVNGRKLATTCT
jgi:hypothetical protein